MKEYAYGKDAYGHTVLGPYTVLDIRVAGVTFKNGRRHRQTILRQVKWHDAPYERIDDENCLDFVVTEYEGEKAVEIWIKNKKAREQIGYVPKEEADFFHRNMEYLDKYFDFKVYGGGEKNYGAAFRVRFKIPGVEFYEEKSTEEIKEKTVNYHQRALELFRKENPQFKNTSYCKVQTEKIAINVYSNKKHIRTVVYNPEKDNIICYDEKMRPLTKIPSKSSEKEKKGNSAGKVAVILLVILILFYWFLVK